MKNKKEEKTISFKKYADINHISLSAAEYRIEYGIESIEDCENASEEFICEFIKDDSLVKTTSHVFFDDNMINDLESCDLNALYAFNYNGKPYGIFTETKTRVITTN